MLVSRARAARKFQEADAYIEQWLAKNHIEVPSGDIGMGAESLFNPEDSNEVIRECIRRKGK